MKEEQDGPIHSIDAHFSGVMAADFTVHCRLGRIYGVFQGLAPATSITIMLVRGKSQHYASMTLGEIGRTRSLYLYIPAIVYNNVLASQLRATGREAGLEGKAGKSVRSLVGRIDTEAWDGMA